MDKELILKNNVRDVRLEQKISQEELAKMVGTSRQTIIAIEKGTFSPTAKLALLLCVALNKKFEELFYF
ncbi:MAG: helix-turn-helix transcriptional regulator [Clostridia bacterium]|nr:helix-turn-helix transcriptional regulator [Clostridia bacterium]